MSDDRTAAASDRPVPRWERIASILRDEILDGRMAAGARLPNEQRLADRFRVNRHTLRRAMQALAHEGHVHVVHGSGTFVRELVLDYALRKRTRMSANLAAVGEHARREMLAWRIAPAATFAGELRLTTRDEVEWIATRASVRGRFVAVSSAVFPIPRLAGIAAAVERFGTVTGALRQLGIGDYTRARSLVSARLPTQDEADLLARSIAQPVLVVHYTNVDGAGLPIETGVTVFAADAVQLSVQPEGDG